MAARIAAESCSQRRVLPSTSVNRKVTVPLGKSRIETGLLPRDHFMPARRGPLLAMLTRGAARVSGRRRPAVSFEPGAEARQRAQAGSKETRMTTSRLGVIDRRMAIGGALAGAAGLALPRRQSRSVLQRGMVGGGLVRFEQGEANFSVFASRLIFAEDEVVVLGSVLWVDETVGLALRSTAITEYIVPEVQPEQGQSRHILGMMSANDVGEYPFELELIDADLPGTGVDMAILTV